MAHKISILVQIQRNKYRRKILHFCFVNLNATYFPFSFVQWNLAFFGLNLLWLLGKAGL